MQTTFALLALAAVALAIPSPQGVSGYIAPTIPAPAGCSASYSGTFQITAVNTTLLKRNILKKRSDCDAEGSLTLTLAGGKLLDAKGRTGYVAANYQFQFDAPPQTGAIYTGGFSVCSNGSLALGGSAVFYECLSGSFYNLYDRSWAAQCEPILIDILPCSSGSSAPAVGQTADGQPHGTTILPAVTQISDGQPQAASAVPISQLGDGQPQVPTAKPIAVSQIPDGQIQATGAAPKPTPTAAPISQISDGQIQATAPPKSTPPAISQISDGQIQATAAPKTTAAAAPISQISDGQIQAGSVTSVKASATPSTAPSATPSTVTTNAGNSLSVGGQFAAVICAALAVALL